MKTIELETHSISIKTNGNCDIIDITSQAEELIINHNFSEGNMILFSGGSTAGITTIEYEPGLLKDYPDFFNRIVPINIRYHHDETWHDGNGHSHVRAALQGASLTVPFSDGKFLLGTWQQIVFIDFDNRARNREITIQITGRKK